MRVAKYCLGPSVIVIMACLLLSAAIAEASFGINTVTNSSCGSPDTPVISPLSCPTASGPVTLGVEADGKTVYIDKGDQVQFRFVEYGSEDSWKMASNPNVEVVSDLRLETYPAQRQLTVRVLAPTDIYFTRKAAPDGGKTRLSYSIRFSGSSTGIPGQTSRYTPPDQAFKIPPVTIGSIGNGNTGITSPGFASDVIGTPIYHDALNGQWLTALRHPFNGIAFAGPIG